MNVVNKSAIACKAAMQTINRALDIYVSEGFECGFGYGFLTSNGRVSDYITDYADLLDFKRYDFEDLCVALAEFVTVEV